LFAALPFCKRGKNKENKGEVNVGDDHISPRDGV